MGNKAQNRRRPVKGSHGISQATRVWTATEGGTLNDTGSRCRAV